MMEDKRLNVSKTKLSVWLDSINLSGLETVFRQNDIDLDVIEDLSNDDLREMGISLGNRKRLLKAIQSLSHPDVGANNKTNNTEIAESNNAASQAEHRHLTVMFCDLVDSTVLSQQLHVEDLRDLMNVCHAKWRDAIIDYGGYVARYMGDGMLVYFGYPNAHEDDPERALRAGLNIIATMSDVNRQFTDQVGVELKVRVGIASGPVVVGDQIGEGESRENAVVGETPNLAARLQGAALPNTVVVSPSTKKLTIGRFSFEDLGEYHLKGIEKPVQLSRVLALVDAKSRFQAKKSQISLTPMVGRDHEISLVLDRWTMAGEGEGQVVLLSGEAGIGKSRIIEAVLETVDKGSGKKMDFQCSQHHGNTALYPFSQYLAREIGLEVDRQSDINVDKVSAFLTERNLQSDENRALCCLLLSIDFNTSMLVEIPKDKQRNATLQFLEDCIRSCCSVETGLVIVEDVHWSDPTTLDFLSRLISVIDQLSLLLIISFRPEFSSSWENLSHVTSFTLNRFSRKMSIDLVSRVAGNKILPGDLCEKIIQKTDGVPLFVEELTKSILESDLLVREGQRYVMKEINGSIAIPATLHDSLLARLDRLGDVKEVAQMASVIGRQFDLELLGKISILDDSALNVAVEKLLQTGLVLKRGSDKQAYYIFKHALVQDAAYQSLLRERRRQIHKAIADALSTELDERRANEPEIIAHHYTQANQHELAITFWLNAGTLSIQRSANVEALEHLKNGLESIFNVPQSIERDKAELQFQVLLAASYRTTMGWGDRQSVSSIKRARVLCDKTGDKVRLLDVLMFERIECWRYARYHEALSIANQLRTLAVQLNLPLDASYAETAMGFPNLALGRIEEVAKSATALRQQYDSEIHGKFRFRYGIDMPVVAGAMGVYCQVLSDDPQSSIDTTESVIEEARAINHAGTLAWALNWVGAQSAAMRGDREICLKYARELMSLPEDARSPMDFAWSQVFAGWAQAVDGVSDEGLELIISGIRYLESENVLMLRSLHLALYLECLVKRQLITESATVLEKIEQHLNSSGECFWNAEVYRLKAAFIRISGGSKEEVIDCLQYAKSFTDASTGSMLSVRIENDFDCVM